ncbi:HEAT repeat domain-containing protein [Streptomyces sp. SUK 48]|uniref:HEAT repeat domain-containing protein n=1 Tax=Streptomyces sp. SUK 48 TaxID=2582831 RepID=UPI00129A2B32|nr:HEAT repeat domain-containing protein [Streptomyces sp. SUK 48]
MREARGGLEPDDTLGKFLQSQASIAGLSARDIAERFQELANQEKSRIEAGVDMPADPMSRMSFSKSHLDRLYKGSASLPSKRFLRIFLGITSHAAGIRPEHHRELCERAEDLLISTHRNRHSRRETGSITTSQAPADSVVATLQLQLELERAQRTEDRLRWALSDTQVLMGTLLQIVNALRDIITDVDAQILRGLRSPEEKAGQDLAKRQRRQAQSYKVTAEAQFDRVNHRRRLLETLWDQAHENLQRLALHAEVTDIPELPDDLALPSHLTLPEEFHASPALADIATALGKVQEHSDAEEQAILDLQRAITVHEPLKLDDELAILVAATRLTDDGTRGTALRTLLKHWPKHPETCDTLVRLARDEQPNIRLTAVWSLAVSWAGHDAARDALVALARDSSANVRETAVQGLAEGWAGDAVARDALVAQTRDSGANIREIAVLGLAEGWAGDAVARDALLVLVRDDDVYVRMTVAESLVDGWLNDGVVRTALGSLSHDASPSVRWAAQQGIVANHVPSGGIPQKTGQDGNLLLAVRLPPDYSEPESIPLFDRLRRGISFDTGVTVLLGNNGTGKTVLLNALALLAPQVISDAPLRGPNNLSRQLTEDLEAVWSERRTPEGVYHLSSFHFEQQRINSRASGAENWVEQWFSVINEKKGPNRLFLLDEPTGSLHREASQLMFEQLNELVIQGCQVIVASVHNMWVEMPAARVIRIDKRSKFRH